MKLAWMSSKAGQVFNFPGLRLYCLGCNNVSILTLILRRGICDLYYTISQCIQSTRSAFLILNFYLAELIITDLLSYWQKPASSSLYILQRTSLLCNLWCEEFLKQSSPTILIVWLSEQNSERWMIQSSVLQGKERKGAASLNLGEVSEEWLSSSSLQTDCTAQQTHPQFTILSSKN